MKKEKEQEYEKTQNKYRITIIILIIIIILLLFLLMMGQFLGKIGYVETGTESIDLIEISEDDVDWDMLEQLNIFKGFNKIAPGDKGEYKFKIKNTTNVNVLYDIQLKEINEHNINMKCKIKTAENKYIVGNEEEGIKPEKINIEDIILTPASSKYYILEWEWEDSENDVEVGSIDKAEYTLRIKVGAEQYWKK